MFQCCHCCATGRSIAQPVTGQWPQAGFECNSGLTTSSHGSCCYPSGELHRSARCKPWLPIRLMALHACSVVVLLPWHQAAEVPTCASRNSICGCQQVAVAPIPMMNSTRGVPACWQLQESTYTVCTNCCCPEPAQRYWPSVVLLRKQPLSYTCFIAPYSYAPAERCGVELIMETNASSECVVYGDTTHSHCQLFRKTHYG